jgi:hypothetical protein
MKKLLLTLALALSCLASDTIEIDASEDTLAEQILFGDTTKHFLSLEYMKRGNIEYKLDTDYAKELQTGNMIQHTGELTVYGLAYNARGFAEGMTKASMGMRWYSFEPDPGDISDNDETANSFFVELGFGNPAIDKALAPLHLHPYLGFGFEYIFRHGDVESIEDTATLSVGTIIDLPVGDIAVEYRTGFTHYYASYGLTVNLNIPLKYFF